MKKPLLIFSMSMIMIAACDKQSASDVRENAPKKIASEENSPKEIGNISLIYKGTISAKFQYFGEKGVDRSYVRLDVTNNTNNAISFNGYRREEYFEIADPYGLSVKTKEEGKGWSTPFMTAGSSLAPPDVIKVSPNTSAELIVLLPASPSGQRIKFCIAPIEHPLEICTSVLSAQEVQQL